MAIYNAFIIIVIHRDVIVVGKRVGTLHMIGLQEGIPHCDGYWCDVFYRTFSLVLHVVVVRGSFGLGFV